MPIRERTWDRCLHCNGSTKCSCGKCCVFLGEGYDHYREGPCTECNGKGGEWRYTDTGELVDNVVRTTYISDDRRR
jgi:hypothetical protein